MSASASLMLSRETVRPLVLVVTGDARRGAEISLAVLRATDADGEVVVRSTLPSALEAMAGGVDLCLFDLSDPDRLDLEACRAVVAAAQGRPVVVVAPELLTPLAAQAVQGGAFAFQTLDPRSPHALERSVQRALRDVPPAGSRSEPMPEADRVCHDLGNVFGGILGVIALLERDPGLSPTQKSRLDLLRGAAERGSDLVTSLPSSRTLRPIESGPGAGTSFEILLQRANETTGPDSTPGPDLETTTETCEEDLPRTAVQTGTVLLVEDDAVLRSTYVELLTGQGWRVISAADGFNALLQANAHRGRIDLLISDIILPQMSGVELWRKLSRYRPEARVLFISGNLDQARILLGRGEDAPHLLGKPFSANALLGTVRTLLAGSPFVRREPPAPA